MTKEQKFFKALQDIFIGAKIEGEGGFINLMRIKSSYYSQIEKLLKDDIDNALEKYPKFREELFDKLYSFFSRYFTESGSIYFNSTPFHNNIYEKVYTDEKDVILFWKTQMLYYVKTDRIFRSMPVEFEGIKFYFDAKSIENKKANEKRSLVFELKKVREDGTIAFDVAYSERGRKTKTDEILRALKKKGVAIKEEELEKAFRVFGKQSEVDFFINKNARAFLQEQFKLWSYQYFWEGAKEWSAERVDQLQILKNIAFKVTDFISQFEDELVKIWNKPKFVRNSNYVITLDRILSACHCEEPANSADKFLDDEAISLIEKILKTKGIKEQIKEWQELGIVDESFKVKDVFETDLTGTYLAKKYEYLPIDTKYFKELEFEILALFDDLDNQLDGWLIKSENYQALNTILPKFKKKVQSCYIDPPYNTGSDEFIYMDKYKESTWLSMIKDRLNIGSQFIKASGNICSSINENELYSLKIVLDDVFAEQNYLANFIVKVRHEERILKGDKPVHEVTENLLYYKKTADHLIKKKEVDNSSVDEYIWEVNELKKCSYNVNWGGKKVEIFKPADFEFTKDKPSENRLKRINIRGSIREGNSSGRFYVRHLEPNFEKYRGHLFKVYDMGIDQFPYRYFFIPENTSKRKNGDYFQGIPINREDIKEVPYPNFFDMVDEFNRTGYEGPKYFGSGKKPEAFVKKVIELSNIEKKGLILDFFLGSGTTVATAHKLGLKWIGIEMGNCFYHTVLHRIKEIVAAKGNNEPCGISKEVKWKGGGFFKYCELEQYEETLANCKYADGDLFNKASDKAYQDYVFMKDEKMLNALEIDYKNNKVKVDLTKLYPDIDIAETLSNLTGKWIKIIRKDEVEFADGTKINTRDLDYKLIKPLIWWE